MIRWLYIRWRARRIAKYRAIVSFLRKRGELRSLYLRLEFGPMVYSDLHALVDAGVLKCRIERVEYQGFDLPRYFYSLA
jgi:hypothetical protein